MRTILFYRKNHMVFWVEILGKESEISCIEWCNQMRLEYLEHLHRNNNIITLDERKTYDVIAAVYI